MGLERLVAQCSHLEQAVLEASEEVAGGSRGSFPARPDPELLQRHLGLMAAVRQMLGSTPRSKEAMMSPSVSAHCPSAGSLHHLKAAAASSSRPESDASVKVMNLEGPLSQIDDRLRFHVVQEKEVLMTLPAAPLLGVFPGSHEDLLQATQKSSLGKDEFARGRSSVLTAEQPGLGAMAAKEPGIGPQRAHGISDVWSRFHPSRSGKDPGWLGEPGLPGHPSALTLAPVRSPFPEVGLPTNSARSLPPLMSMQGPMSLAAAPSPLTMQSRQWLQPQQASALHPSGLPLQPMMLSLPGGGLSAALQSAPAIDMRQWQTLPSPAAPETSGQFSKAAL